MTASNSSLNKVAIITGGAKRIGAVIAKTLHSADYDLLIHYRNSAEHAEQLANELNQIRNHSCQLVAGDLDDQNAYSAIVNSAINHYGRIDALINNASSFYPTPIDDINEAQWQDLMASNLKAPMFLSKYAVPELRKTQGNIINIIDIYAQRPLADHPIYCAAKAGLQMLTKSLARDLQGKVRVNAVSPGAILWPESNSSESTASEQNALLEKIPLNRMGKPEDIANTVKFLIDDNDYINGQIISVDGGRTVMP